MKIRPNLSEELSDAEKAKIHDIEVSLSKINPSKLALVVDNKVIGFIDSCVAYGDGDEDSEARRYIGYYIGFSINEQECKGSSGLYVDTIVSE